MAGDHNYRARQDAAARKLDFLERVPTMTNRNRVRVSKLALGLALALAAAPAFAQNTSAGVGGTVSGADGAPVAGATVTIVHAESGTTANATTDASGHYSARGLRPGGPYTITITKDGVTETRDNVYLQLGEVTSVDASVGSSATTLDTVQVTGTNLGVSDAFSTDSMGAGTNVTQLQLERQPSIDRSIADVIKLDPRIVKLDRETQQVTVSGQNPRFNNIKIDGVPTNDNFGLNDSGLPALNQPISGDWISQYNIGISGYDVDQADFVGANINAVTKSGTNNWQGTLYWIYRDNDHIRENENGTKFQGLTDEWTRGAYVGGPIIKDKFFIFAGYEEFQRSNTLPPRGVAGSDATTQLLVTQDQVDAITASYDRLFGAAAPRPGASPEPFDNTDKKKFLKLDYNFSDAHRASLRYNETDGSVARFSRTTGQLQLASNVYSDNIRFKSLALNLYDDWTDNLSSEFHVSKANYDSAPSSSVRMPQITLRNITGAGTNTVVFGTERSRHANILGVDTLTSALTFNYFMGDHELKFGADYEKSDVYNLFLQDVFGNYTIDYCQFTNTTCSNGSTPNNTAANLPWAFYNFQRPSSGNTLDDVAAQFSVATLGLMLQDTWTATNNLSLTYGLRLDTNYVGGTPKENVRFHNDFGIDNRNTIDGNHTLQPRFGFNYTFPTENRMQLRGGVGRFLGSAPGVWVSNSFSNPGVGVDSFAATNGSSVTVDPDNPFVPSSGGVASRQVNSLSDDFKQPTVLKANLAFETELGVADLVGGIEVLLTEVEEGVRFTNLALGTPNGVLPDGREFYWANAGQSGFSQTSGSTTGSNRNQANCILVNPANPFDRNTNPCAYTNAILLSNTKRGSAQNLTVFLEKPWKDNWSAKVGYTYGRADEVSPATSSVAFSNWNGRFVYNPNDEQLGRANYEIKDRFTATASYRWNWFGENAPTTVSMFYEGRSGRPFSYAFANDANGDGQSNDLFYIPLGPTDVAYTAFNAVTSAGSSPQDIAAFWDYVYGNGYLDSHRGQVARRNGDRAPFVNQIDLRISQKFPLFRDRQSEVFLDIQNFGNLLNKKWGRIEEAGFPSRVQMARFAGVDASGNYVYDVSQFYDESKGVATTPALELRDVAAESRWSAQVGIKINF